MSSSPDPRTSATLLWRLRDLNDVEAWNDFVDRYTPRIVSWCRRHHLQDSDIADVTQEVLRKLVTALRTFQHDPNKGSFRGWLKTVVHNTIRDLQEEWNRGTRGEGSDSAHEWVAELADPSALADLTAELEAEAERELVRQAEYQVQLRVKPATWQAYEQTAVQQLSANEVAQALGMTVAEVYVAKSRVLKLLREEVQHLENPGS